MAAAGDTSDINIPSVFIDKVISHLKLKMVTKIVLQDQADGATTIIMSPHHILSMM